jgi:Ni/Co efflux regulator RcnB
MKRIATTALAALLAAGSLGTGVANAQTWRDGDRNGQNDRRDDRNDRRDDRRDDRQDRRDDRRENQRWNDRAYNGYYVNGRFYRGQPNYQQMQRRDYRPAWQQWRRGDRLTTYGRQHYREVDWRREHYRAPPRGYHYIRDDRGEVLLVGLATGDILSILLSQ